MFKKCIINQVVIHASLCGKNLFVVQRYLRRYYFIRASITALKSRKRYLWLSGKVKQVATDKFNNAWKSTYNE